MGGISGGRRAGGGVMNGLPIETQMMKLSPPVPCVVNSDSQRACGLLRYQSMGRQHHSMRKSMASDRIVN